MRAAPSGMRASARMPPPPALPREDFPYRFESSTGEAGGGGARSATEGAGCVGARTLFDARDMAADVFVGREGPGGGRMEAAHHVVGIFRAGLTVGIRRRDDDHAVSDRAAGEEISGDGRDDLVAMPFGFAECGPVVAPVIPEARGVADFCRTPVEKLE